MKVLPIRSLVSGVLKVIVFAIASRVTGIVPPLTPFRSVTPVMVAFGSLSLASSALHGTTTVVESDTRMVSSCAPLPVMLIVTVCTSEALPSVACTV